MPISFLCSGISAGGRGRGGGGGRVRDALLFSSCAFQSGNCGANGRLGGEMSKARIFL